MIDTDQVRRLVDVAKDHPLGGIEVLTQRASHAPSSAASATAFRRALAWQRWRLR
jgi:hypothetical protein